MVFYSTHRSPLASLPDVKDTKLARELAAQLGAR